MKAELCFTVKLPWQQTLYEPLIDLAVNYKWIGIGIWVFKMEDKKKVEAVIGQSIEIEGYCGPYTKTSIIVPNWKGDDALSIIEFPKIYQIIEHRKREDGSIAEIKNLLGKEVVVKVWNDVIAHQPLNKPVKTRAVAEKICKALGVTRFNRQTGSFDFDKFFGARKDYYHMFYLPMKVLSYQNKIIHHKYGAIERII